MKEYLERYGHSVAPLAIIATAILIYYQTISFPFQFDDISVITQNREIHNLTHFFDLSGKRYIGDLSFAINYYFGHLDVTGYHIVNIAIHAINGILVWSLVNLTFRTPVMEKSAINPQVRRLIAITAALVFISHPLQTQAVTYIIQRYASLATLFYLSSIVLFIKWRLSAVSAYRVHFFLLSLIAAVFAVKTKEISLTLPFIILLYAFFFFRDRLRNVLFLLPYFLMLLIIPLTLINTDKPLGDIIGELEAATEETEHISRGTYLFTQFRVIVTYMRLLLFPVNQNVDYDYPLYTSLFSPVVFLSLLLLLFMAGAGIYLYKMSRRSVNGYALLVSFGIFWFFITLSVESSIIPIRDVIFEHRLYLPGIGFIMAFISAILWGIEYWKRQVCFIILIMVIPLGVAAHQRNTVWQDNVTLWRDVVSKSPLKARGHHNLGYAYAGQGRIYEAIEEYKTALGLKKIFAETHNELGLLYSNLGRLDEAIEEFQAAVKLKPDYANAHNNLGLAYRARGELDKAIGEYGTALKLNPSHVNAHSNLGNAYAGSGRLEEAIEEYLTALKLQPGHLNARNNLGVAYYKQGKTDEAIGEFRKVLSLKPDHANASYYLDLAYKKKGLKK